MPSSRNKQIKHPSGDGTLHEPLSKADVRNIFFGLMLAMFLSALNQTIVCASESFKFDISSYVEASGESVQGSWRESSRDVSGHITGRIAEGRFQGEIVAPAFTAAVSLTSNGRTQNVSFQTRGGDISDVRIELRRRG